MGIICIAPGHHCASHVWHSVHTKQLSQHLLLRYGQWSFISVTVALQ